MTDLQAFKTEISRLDREATDGPWVADTMDDAPYVWSSDGSELLAKTWQDDRLQGAKNRDFIAYARTALPQLLALAEDLQARLTVAEDAL